ncbi:MAG: hypothetical protein KGI78_04575 [Patescibacteria group bacterium]|nr:hypothetical protein [Patescibacteria group bacterium]MDE1944255.1 hypothetical protein [Patescibacteria group bacterium]MDE1945227.1 hypothetical protein [Patescibacteria group bacterium]MDE2058084.1 hypothetical protein [Patescibacteria group bacterium]
MQEEADEKMRVLLSKAVVWAETQSAEIIATGRPLYSEEAMLAKRAGVAHPEKVRISEVESLPFPEDQELRGAALSLGLFKPSMVGLTLGYGIYIVDGHQTRFVPHELRHVHQFERLGSIKSFLNLYLQQLLECGYEKAPLEIEAREYEPG